MPQKYYKIVAVLKNKSKVSLNHDQLPPSISVKYKIGKWTKPKIPHSKLFVFCDLLYARAAAAADNDQYEVYECEIKDGEEISTRLSLVGFDGLPTKIRKFWQFWQQNVSTHEDFPTVPFGTVVASAVKLTKKVF